jgi:hypothetical protein
LHGTVISPVTAKLELRTEAGFDLLRTLPFVPGTPARARSIGKYFPDRELTFVRAMQNRRPPTVMVRPRTGCTVAPAAEISTAAFTPYRFASTFAPIDTLPALVSVAPGCA